MNQAGDVKIEFDEAMAYTDSTDKYVTLSAGGEQPEWNSNLFIIK